MESPQSNRNVAIATCVMGAALFAVGIVSATVPRKFPLPSAPAPVGECLCYPVPDGPPLETLVSNRKIEFAQEEETRDQFFVSTLQVDAELRIHEREWVLVLELIGLGRPFSWDLGAALIVKGDTIVKPTHVIRKHGSLIGNMGMTDLGTCAMCFHPDPMQPPESPVTLRVTCGDQAHEVRLVPGAPPDWARVNRETPVGSDGPQRGQGQ